MEFIKLRIQGYRYKPEAEKDEMDALTRSVLKDIGKISIEEDDKETEDEPIWMDHWYSKEYLQDSICWIHKGLADDSFSVIYFTPHEFVLVDMPVDQLFDLLNGV